MTRVADDPRWASDPAPSWNDIAPDWPFHQDTPEEPGGGIDEVTAKLWPNVHPAAQEVKRCPMCGNLGWVLDCNDLGKPGGRCVEFMPCFYPTCERWPDGPSGQPLTNLVFKGVEFGHVSRHPAGGWVMSLSSPSHQWEEHEWEEVYIRKDEPEHMRLCPDEYVCPCGARKIPAARSESGRPEFIPAPSGE